MSSLYDISTLCIRFTWLIMTPTVLVTACFVNLVGKLSDSMFHGSCDICFALHCSDSLDRPSDYTPGTVLRISMFFLLANPVFVQMSNQKRTILLFLNRCFLCHENKSGTFFECPSSGLLTDTDDIEFEVYLEVDLTRQSLSACATGTTMKGTLL